MSKESVVSVPVVHVAMKDGRVFEGALCDWPHLRINSIDSVYPAPWERHMWDGSLVSVDGTSAADFSREDVAEVVAWETTVSSSWQEGDTAGIARLKDGRFIGWEASVGLTGDGFQRDAYGGESDILFAVTAERLLVEFSQSGRELLGSLACTAKEYSHE